jgi:hypothetical protein
MPFGRLEEARVQHAHGAFGKAETSGRNGPGNTHIRERAKVRARRATSSMVNASRPTSRPAASAASTISARRRSFSSSLRFGDIAHGRGMYYSA